MKKINNKKGFTLVEIIVVLVIIAILAAATVPSMLSFVDKAKQSEETANARSVFLATQAVVTEKFAADSAYDQAKFDADTNVITNITNLSGHTQITANTLDVTLDVSNKTVSEVEYETAEYEVLIEADKTVTVTKK